MADRQQPTYKELCEQILGGSDLSKRSTQYKAIHDALSKFENYVENNKEKGMAVFESKEIEDLQNVCNEYINSHHPLTSAGKKQLNSIKDLRGHLNSMQGVAKECHDLEKDEQEIKNTFREASKHVQKEDFEKATGVLITSRYNESYLKTDYGSKMRLTDTSLNTAAREIGGGTLSQILREKSSSILHNEADMRRHAEMIDMAASTKNPFMLPERAPAQRQKAQSAKRMSFQDLAKEHGSKTSPRPVREGRDMTQNAPEKKGVTLGKR